jgi:FkbM family methyltransferase
MIQFLLNSNNVPLALQIENVLCKNDGDVCIAEVFLSLLHEIDLDSSWRIVDVGADQGGFSLLSANLLPENTVFAFEPNFKSYRLLTENLQTFGNKYRNIITLPIAISSSEGTIHLTEEEGCSNSRGTTGREVITKRLDTVLPVDSTIFFMKVDTEGHDLEVLESARKFIDEDRLKNIVFEYTAYWIGSSEDSQQSRRSGEDEAVAKSKPILQYLLSKYKLYSLSRTGRPYLVGPLGDEDLEPFIRDHYRRHLQTDILATTMEPKLKIFPHEVGKYIA